MGVKHKRVGRSEHAKPQQNTRTGLGQGRRHLRNDPLSILSPTMAQGKHIYREACDEKLGWNAVVSEKLAKAWLKWIAQLRSVKVPRSLVRQCNEVKSIDLHLFADASSLACSVATTALVKQDTGTVPT